MSKRRRGGSPSQGKTGRPAGREWPEVMRLGQACEYLGVSRAKLTSLLKSQTLKHVRNELDHREKLVKKSDLDELKRKSRPE